MLLLAYADLLVFSDDYLHSQSETPVVQALVRLSQLFPGQITWDLYWQDLNGFVNALATSPAKVALVDNNSFYALSDHLNELYNWALERPLIITTFNVDTAAGHPLWALAGAQWRGDVSQDTTSLILERSIFNWPEEVPDTLFLSHLYEDRGDSLVSIGGVILTLFEGGSASAVMSSDCRVTLVGFLPAEAEADWDGDGVQDGVEFYEDLIYYVLDCNGLLVSEGEGRSLRLAQRGLELWGFSPRPAQLLLYSASGRLTLRKEVKGEFKVSLRGLRPGVYLARLGSAKAKVLVR